MNAAARHGSDGCAVAASAAATDLETRRRAMSEHNGLLDEPYARHVCVGGGVARHNDAYTGRRLTVPIVYQIL